MIRFPNPPRFSRKKNAIAPPAPATLTLLAASFDDETLTLVFSRAVSIAAYDGAATRVNAPVSNALFAADLQVTLSPDGHTIMSEAEFLDPSPDPTAWLTVPAGSGIVDAASGAAWAGCDQLALPFG